MGRPIASSRRPRGSASRRQDLLRVSAVEWADQGPLDFHAVAFDLLADVATLPPSTKSLQVPMGMGEMGPMGEMGERRQRDFPCFFLVKI